MLFPGPPSRMSSPPALENVVALAADQDVVIVAASRRETDRFDAVQLHRDVGHASEEAHLFAERGDVEGLAHVGAAEDHRVEALLAAAGVRSVAAR